MSTTSKVMNAPKNRVRPVAVTRDDIVWAYRTILGREPENEQVLTPMLEAGLDFRGLVVTFLQSAEYRANAVYAASSIIDGLHKVQDIEVEVGDQDMKRLISHIRKVWSRYGQEDPFWSVLTNEKYRKSNISNTDVQEFYSTGASSVDFFEENCRQNGIVAQSRSSVLDFGCGIGRIGEHFARRYKSYVGVDISSSHLGQAKAHLTQLTESGIQLGDFQFMLLEDFLKNRKLQYDVFFSFLVLQHNPPPLIRYLLSYCLSKVKKDGLAFFQVPNYIYNYRFSVADYLEGKGRSDEMEMHPLPQPHVFKLLAQQGFSVLKVLPHSSIGPAGLSLLYMAQRTVVRPWPHGLSGV